MARFMTSPSVRPPLSSRCSPLDFPTTRNTFRGTSGPVPERVGMLKLGHIRMDVQLLVVMVVTPLATLAMVGLGQVLNYRAAKRVPMNSKWT